MADFPHPRGDPLSSPRRSHPQRPSFLRRTIARWPPKAKGIAIALAATAMLGGSSCTKTVIVPASPSTVTVTQPVGKDSPADQSSADYPYPGYPKVVSTQEVPKFMRSEASGDTVIAVAPGVYTVNVEGVEVMEGVRDGTYFGYCAAVKKAERLLNNISGNSCW